jgi:hypothetical protein
MDVWNKLEDKKHHNLVPVIQQTRTTDAGKRQWVQHWRNRAVYAKGKTDTLKKS